MPFPKCENTIIVFHTIRLEITPSLSSPSSLWRFDFKRFAWPFNAVCQNVYFWCLCLLSAVFNFNFHPKDFSDYHAIDLAKLQTFTLHPRDKKANAQFFICVEHCIILHRYLFKWFFFQTWPHQLWWIWQKWHS